jgi:hypothetical protein
MVAGALKDIVRQSESGHQADRGVDEVAGYDVDPESDGMILQQADSLTLTREQADRLATLSHLFAVYADSMWTPASKYLESLPEG